MDAAHERKEDSEIVIINTCGFIDNAKQESIDTILRFADAKHDGKVEKVYVTGCLSQRYRDELMQEIPEVDAWFGTMELPLLLKKLNADYKHELLGERVLTTSSHFAFLKISEGCDRPCSFCAIPLMRGGHVSKPIEQLVLEAENLAKNGTKELILIAQDSTYYGLDLYGKRVLAQLLERLSDVKGIEWIRLHYAFPSGFPLDVLDVMQAKNNICNYLDIPLQSGSTAVLKSMRRGITREKTEKLIEKMREKVPGITLRTTLIAGYPGETPEDHQETLKFVEAMKFDRLGVFTYSHEEQTHAYGLEDDVKEEEKERRASEIMQLQEDISFEKNQEMVGNTKKILIDRMEGGHYIGRTAADSPEVDNEVLIDASKHFLRIGDFCNAKILKAEAFDLYAEPV